MEIRFLGHSTFELSEGDARVLVDPFLKPNNPASTVTADELEPTHILITHGHADHMADAVGAREADGCPLRRDRRARQLARGSAASRRSATRTSAGRWSSTGGG